MVVMVNLGIWQLDRLQERRAHNREVTSRTTVATVDVTELFPAGATVDTAPLEWRPVQATGIYDTAHEVAINDRSLDGVAGLHVVTPLVLADGRALLVNRGWIPAPPKVGEAPQIPPPPSGTVTLTGRVRPSQKRGLLGPKDKTTGTLTRLSRVDIPRIAAQTPAPILPVYVEEIRSDDGAIPRPIPLPELDDGPHLSYAGQWFLFTLCAAGGWFALVRRKGKQTRQEARRAELSAATPPADGAGLPGPDAVAATTETPGTAGS
jgi:cytochrome oxidase assembly protein ShyY1